MSWVPPYDPQPRQRLLHATTARQVLYGGAVGGGKSTALRWDAIEFCCNNPGLRAFIFRRTLRELKDNHIRWLRNDLPAEMGVWHENDKAWKFPNGSELVCGFAENEGDIHSYQGSEIHWLGVDEAGQFTPYQLAFLRSRNRVGSFEPADVKRIPRCVMTANPGGISHNFLKQTFIDPAPAETEFIDRSVVDPKKPIGLGNEGWSTLYIPARMDDNRFIDSGYAGQLAGLPPELAEALREGDWDIVVGSFFGANFSRSLHVISEFEIPEHWARFCAYDHGSSAPFSVGWYAVASEDYEHPQGVIPRGAMVKYREWYGADAPQRGLKLPAEQIAVGIKDREKGEKIAYRVADPSVWKIDSGPSIGERMLRMGVTWRKADNSRIAGWESIRGRLVGKDGRPLLYFFESCLDTIRTLPVLQSDAVRLEDINTKQEDHAADELRYACQSRPFAKELDPEPEDPWRMPTIAEWQKSTRQASKVRARI